MSLLILLEALIGNKTSTFTSQNDSADELNAKKKIADEISQMIIENLRKYQTDDKSSIKHSRSGIFGLSDSRKRFKKNIISKSKILNRNQPDIDKYVISLRKSNSKSYINIGRPYTHQAGRKQIRTKDNSIDLNINTSGGHSSHYLKGPNFNSNHNLSFFNADLRQRKDEKPIIKINGDVVEYFNEILTKPESSDKIIKKDSMARRLYSNDS